MLKHWTSAGAANRPQVRSGYSRSGLEMTAICVFRPKTGGRRDWLYPLPTRADSSVGLRAPRGHLTLAIEGRNKNEAGEVSKRQAGTRMFGCALT
jgi:hypothetical protein